VVGEDVVPIVVVGDVVVGLAVTTVGGVGSKVVGDSDGSAVVGALVVGDCVGKDVATMGAAVMEPVGVKLGVAVVCNV
jgi:hypothetical protein